MAPPNTMFDSSPDPSATSERSDQLPSVEEVKMMQAARRESNQSLSSKPSDIETAFSGSQEFSTSEHDQLPSVEDIRLESPRNGKCRRIVKVSFWTALLVIVTVTAVTLAVVLTKDDSNGDLMDDQDFFTGNAAVPVDTTPTTSAPAKTEAPVATTNPPVTSTTTTAPENNSEPAFVSRLPAAIQLLSEAGVSTKSILEQDGSPQQKAVLFVADKDPAPVALNDADAFVERYALAVFFYSAGGEEWINSMNFLSGLPTCRWYINGLAADKKTQRKYGASCNDAGMVARIHVRKYLFFRLCTLLQFVMLSLVLTVIDIVFVFLHSSYLFEGYLADGTSFPETIGAL